MINIGAPIMIASIPCNVSARAATLRPIQISANMFADALRGRGDEVAITGGCHCGAVRYEADGEALTHALCHCRDCRRSSGAPMVGWTMYRLEAVKVIRGAPKIYESSEHGRRHFCPDCGTGLFYTNAEMLPGIIDVRSATYDNPDAVPARAHIQVAERIGWMERAHELPTFERYPPRK